MIASRVGELKLEARRLYIQIHNRSSDLDCGAHLAEFLRPDIGKAKARFNEVMTELATIDPEAKALLERVGPLR